MTAADTAPTRLLVCTSCRADGEPPEPSDERAGARLFRALQAACDTSPGAVDLVPVECLSVCRRPCTVGFAAPGKWTYVYGDFPAADARAILDAAALYAAAPDGLIPWKLRPLALKKGVVARLPPLDLLPSKVGSA